MTGRGKSELDDMMSLFRLWSTNAIRQEVAVGELTERTGAVESISRLIGSLADQCNILAVNATIEASRAGEHGRGFAVVANEVRGLADQTKKSAAEINRLIVAMSGAVEIAAKLIHEGKAGADRGLGKAKDTEDTFEKLWKSSASNREAAIRLKEVANETSDLSHEIQEEFHKLRMQMDV